MPFPFGLRTGEIPTRAGPETTHSEAPHEQINLSPSSFVKLWPWRSCGSVCKIRLRVDL